MITIFHNPKCRKSRAGLQYLQSKQLEVVVIDYQKTPFNRQSLSELLMKLDYKAIQLVRVQDDVFKQKFKGKSFTNEEWISILLENPKLIQRPIVVRGYKAVVGDPVEEIDRLL